MGCNDNCEDSCFVECLTKDVVDIVDVYIEWNDIVKDGDSILSTLWQIDAEDGGLSIVAIENLDTVQLTNIDRARIGDGVPGEVYRLCNTITTANGIVKRRCVTVTVYTHEGLTDYDVISFRAPFSGAADFQATFSVLGAAQYDFDGVADFQATFAKIKPLAVAFDGSASSDVSLSIVQHIQADFTGASSEMIDFTKIQDGEFNFTGKAAMTVALHKYDPKFVAAFSGSAHGSATLNVVKPFSAAFTGSSDEDVALAVIPPTGSSTAFEYDGVDDSHSIAHTMADAGGSYEIHFAFSAWPAGEGAVGGYRETAVRNRIFVDSNGLQIQFGDGTVASKSLGTITLGETHILKVTWAAQNVVVELDGVELANRSYTGSIVTASGYDFGLGVINSNGGYDRWTNLKIGTVIFKDDAGTTYFDSQVDGFGTPTGTPTPTVMPPYAGTGPPPEPPPNPGTWWGIGYDSQTNRTLIDDSGYVDRLVTNDSELSQALNDAKGGSVDRIFIRPKSDGSAYVYPSSGLVPYDREGYGYDPQTSPLVIATEESALPTRAKIDNILWDVSQSRNGRMAGIWFKDLDIRRQQLMFGTPNAQHIFYEGCVFNSGTGGTIILQTASVHVGNELNTSVYNICFRYCFFDSAHQTGSGHISNMYTWNVSTNIEYCTLYHGGWGRTMTRDTSASVGGPNIFKHNYYCDKNPNDFNNGLNIYRFNVFMDASSHNLHARTGGQITDNIFARGCLFQVGYNADTRYGLWDSSGTVARNIFVEVSDISNNPFTPRGQGMYLHSVKNLLVEGNKWLFNGTTSVNNVVFDFAETASANNPPDATVVIRDNISHQWGIPYTPAAWWNLCTTSGNMLDDGTPLVDPDRILTEYNADALLAEIEGGTAGSAPEGASPMFFTKNWIEGVLADCHAWGSPA